VSEFNTERVPAIDIKVGDTVVLVGSITAVVEWTRVWSDGGVSLAGKRSTGEPFTNCLSTGAMMTRVIDQKDS
jgi:hypothetical protein